MALNDLSRGQSFKSSDRLRSGSHYYCRDETIELQALLDEAAVVAANYRQPPAYIHAYCDRLIFTPPVVNGTATAQLKNTKLRSLFIYARSIAFDPAVRWLLFAGVNALQIRFIFDHCPSALWVGLTLGSTRIPVNLEADLPAPTALDADLPMSTRARVFAQNPVAIALRQQSIGREILLLSPDPCLAVLIRNLPSLELDSNLLIGQLTASNPLIEFCLELFEKTCTQLTSAERADDQQRQDDAFCSRLRFIVALTRNSLTCADLCDDAQNLLERLDLPRRSAIIADSSWAGLRLDVPQLVSSEDHKAVQAHFTEIAAWEGERKDILKGIEDRKLLDQVVLSINTQSADRFAGIEANLEQMQSQFVATQQTVLKAIGYAVDDYTDLDALLAEFKSAAADIARKEKDMKDANQNVRDARAVLAKSLWNYEGEQENKFIFACMGAAAEFTLVIGVTVATAGAAAPAAAAAAADGAAKVASAAARLAKLKEALKKLVDLVFKLGAKLNGDAGTTNRHEKAATTLGAKAKEMVTKAAELVSKTAPESVSFLPAKATAPLDYLGILADWEEFKIDIDALFDETAALLSPDTVDGTQGFRNALRKLCVRGEILLQARARAQEAAIRFNHAFAEAVKREARKLEVDRMAQTLTSIDFKKQPVQASFDLTDQYVKATASLRSLCEERLAHLRRAAVVSLYSYMANIMYEQCIVSFPQTVRLSSSMTNAAWTDADKKLLDIAKAQAAKRVAPDSLPALVLSTEGDDGKVFDMDWKIELESTGIITLLVPKDRPETKPYYRMRMDTIKIALDGLKFKAGRTLSAVSYRVVQGPVFADTGSRDESLQYIITTTDEFHRTDFLDIQTWTTSTAGRRADTDDAKKYQYPALFCQITLKFDEETAQALDFEAVKKVVVTLGATGTSK